MTSYHIDINIYIYIYTSTILALYISLLGSPADGGLIQPLKCMVALDFQLLPGLGDVKLHQNHSATSLTSLARSKILPISPREKKPLASWNKLINLHDKLINTRSMWQSQDRPKPRSHQESIHWDSLGPQTFWKMCDLSCRHRAEVTRFLHGTALFVWSLCISKTIIIEECMNATWRNIALLLEFHFNVTRLLINWGWWSKLL